MKVYNNQTKNEPKEGILSGKLAAKRKERGTQKEGFRVVIKE